MRPASRAAMGVMLSCYEALYRVLGEGAPALSVDAYLIRTYELARAFGELASETRVALGEEREALEVLERALSSALEVDPTGAVALYGLAAGVVPRLLVSLADARRALAGDEVVEGLVDRARERIVAEVRAIGALAPSESAEGAPRARAMAATLEAAGFGDSFNVLA